MLSCNAKRQRTINIIVKKRLNMEQFHHFGTVFVKEDRETGKVVQKPCLSRHEVAHSCDKIAR